MLRINLTFISLLLLTVITQVNGQIRNLEFTEYTVIDGLRLGKINSIAQDQNGFLWLSDQGNRAVLRYDGKHITKYQYDPNEPNSPEKIGGFYPECFFIEESGVIWIGFYGQGLDRFDPATNTFTHFRNNPEDSNSLSNDFVTAITEDRSGNFWIATYAGLNKLDRRTGKFSSYQYDPGNNRSLSCDTIRSLYLDKKGTLWIGTGITWDLNINRGGLNRYNPETNSFTRFLHNPDDPSTLINNKVRSIFEDSEGTFWIGTGGDGLHTMDRETGRFTRHTYDPGNPEKLSRPPLGNATDRITFIKEDADGQIWIGTDANGINRYNPETGKVKHIVEPFENGAWWMYNSGDDQVWITTNRAQLIRINLFKYTISNVTERLDFLIEESPDISWIGNNNGLIKSNKKTGKKVIYQHDPADSTTLTSNQISCMLLDSRGILWVGTWLGLNRFDRKTGLVKRYKNIPGVPSSMLSNEVSIIIEDSKANLWIGSAPGGLDKFDPVSEVFTHYEYDLTNSRSLNGFVVTDIEEGTENIIWVAFAANGGLNKFKVDQGTFDLYLHGLDVFELFTDRSGVLWAATRGGGRFRYDAEKDKFLSTTISEEVVSVYEDIESNLWVSSHSGVYKMNPERIHISYFESKVEELGNGIFENLGIAYALNGKQYLGNWNGYFIFDPNILIEHPDTTKVFVFEVRDVSTSDRSNTLYMHNPAVNSLVLGQDQNTFSIIFIETDFQNNVDDQIYYMLENYDVEWRKASSGDWINYYRVPTGNYTLMLKSSSSSGIWAENQFQIKVSPPWWLTWWAYILYGIVVLSLVLIVHRLQKSRTIRKEQEKIKDRELEQAKKIEQAYTDLKSTQTQLIHAEKMASLGELTAGIAHEIQNPLNFVNNFSEVSKEMIEELKAERLKVKAERDEGLEEELLNDINENLQKIHHHGQRASNIVKGMLAHSRSGTSKKELTDINILVDEYLRLSYHGLRAKDKSFNADFKTDLDPALPKINVVPQDIGRVLLNLISNAFYAVDIKAKEGNDGYKPEMLVTTKVIPLPGGERGGLKEVRITVQDNGPGIPAEIKDKIFQPFFTTKPTGSGTGLGLSLSYDIVKAHGGELKVETKEGIGSEFIIHLPLV